MARNSCRGELNAKRFSEPAPEVLSRRFLPRWRVRVLEEKGDLQKPLKLRPAVGRLSLAVEWCVARHLSPICFPQLAIRREQGAVDNLFHLLGLEIEIE